MLAENQWRLVPVGSPHSRSNRYLTFGTCEVNSVKNGLEQILGVKVAEWGKEQIFVSYYPHTVLLLSTL